MSKISLTKTRDSVFISNIFLSSPPFTATITALVLTTSSVSVRLIKLTDSDFTMECIVNFAGHGYNWLEMMVIFGT